MIDLKGLPRVPVEALKEILLYMLKIIPETSGTIDKLDYQVYSEVSLCASAARMAANRVENETVRTITDNNIEVQKEQNLIEYRGDIERIIESLLLADFENHFLDQDSIAEFDQAKLSKTEKDDIRDLLSKARSLTADASYLSDDHKRRIAHRISEVENELYKETVGFKAFLVAAADVSGLVKKYGEDAEPLAEAIKKARTITEMKVTGYQKIEAAEKPKSLPKPDS